MSHPALASLLARHDRRTRRAFIGALIFFVALGVGLGIAIGVIGLVLTGVVAACFGLLMLIMWDNSRRLRAILDEPNDIVWVYPVQQSVNGVQTATPVAIVSKSKGEARLTGVPPREAMAALAQALPHALIGYGKEQSVRYREIMSGR
jgi:hypothetical protein